MFFKVINNWSDVGLEQTNKAFLLKDGWDDWFSFATTFTLWVYDAESERHRIGSVKIGKVGLQPSGEGIEPGPGVRYPEPPDEFDSLENNYFSLGQGEDYYETLNNLSTEIRLGVLLGLRDCAYDLEIFEANYQEQVMSVSLLRSSSPSAVRGRLHRLSRGNTELTEYKFSYLLPNEPEDTSRPSVALHVIPHSKPPTNVHVLIGRNGVGKTRCMRGLALALLGREAENDNDAVGQLIKDQSQEEWSFAGLVVCSFSAFDQAPLGLSESDQISLSQIGLLDWIEEENGIKNVVRKTPQNLAEDFTKSFELCRYGLRSDRWLNALETLQTDDLFAEAQITDLLELEDDNWKDAALAKFKRLSSGHAIVLLTITKLVELVDENTLVLLDEPEAHLHPPLLSAFIRAISDLLVKRNGVAIVATHSPVVLQEVPRSCAWKLRRSGYHSVTERPVIETFGENISILNREVFGFEITKSGFHRMLGDAIDEDDLSYEQVVDLFSEQLGAEARAVVRALTADRTGHIE